MRILLYSSTYYTQDTFEPVARAAGVDVTYETARLSFDTAHKAHGYDAVCAFVNDDLSRDVIKVLASYGIKKILMRCAGSDRVDVEATKGFGIQVYTVPSYSPESIAEHSIALLLSALRQLKRSFEKVEVRDFSLHNLTGTTVRGKTVGLIGCGRIGSIAVKILEAMGADLLIYDPAAKWSNDLYEVLTESDIIMLFCPLLPTTKYTIRKETIDQMKKGVVIVNVARGGLVNTADMLFALQDGRVGHYAADVYEHEAGYFFNKFPAKDHLYEWLQSQPNCTLTAHQAFLTKEALAQIAQITINNALQ